MPSIILGPMTQLPLALTLPLGRPERLGDLAPGTYFALETGDGWIGKVLRIGPGAVEVELRGDRGVTRTTWSLGAMVRRVGGRTR